MTQLLMDLAATRAANNPVSLTAVCCAHPMILQAALRYGRKMNIPVLIEATCNQVNHEGGYTGMKPQDFVDQVFRIAHNEKFDTAQLVLGGDHLGPNPWRKLNSCDAMNQAELMVRAFAKAGFNKFHLDASMRCADDPEILEEEEIARRAVRLAKAIEETCKDRQGPAPVYIIGTEVPPPGGANHALHIVMATDPQAALMTIATHRRVFHEAGLDDAFGRAIALVVQPGVEFGDVNVHQYKPENATELNAVLEFEPSFCFEAHSSDYQTAASLNRLAIDGYRIQKVGPWLSFALREALYALDLIASELNADYPQNALKDAMEKLMLEHPENWQDHYTGTDREKYLKRHYSYSDRIRYYWTSPVAEAAVARLLDVLSGTEIPDTLISQYLPASWRNAMENSPSAEELILDAIETTLRNYPTPNPVTSSSTDEQHRRSGCMGG